jgi:hypothetical protein
VVGKAAYRWLSMAAAERVRPSKHKSLTRAQSLLSSLSIVRRTTALVLALGVLPISVLACARNSAIAAARVEFHERWNAQQFHEMYSDSVIKEKAISREDQWIYAWSRQHRDFGKFEKDLSDGPVSESQISYDGYQIVTQRFNTRFATYPVVESFSWQVKGDQVRLLSYGQLPNAEIRCERRLLGSDCRAVRLGAVAATRP